MKVVLFVITVLLILSFVGYKKFEQKEVTICSSFEFNLEQSDWAKARQKMHLFAINSGLPFRDESDSPDHDIAYLNARIVSNYFGIQYVLSTDTYWSKSATKAVVSFYANKANYCPKDDTPDSYRKLYMEIKNGFSKDWKIVEFNTVKIIKYQN